MEIEQYLYDLTESGDAIVAYTMRSASGGFVQICNLGATILAWSPEASDEGIAAGSCVRGVRGMECDSWGGVKFSEMLWESRVEVNRVVMSLQYESDSVGVMCEVVFDYDDDNTLEITYIASPDADYTLDFTHKLSFNLGEATSCNVASDTPLSVTTQIYPIKNAKRAILSEVANITSTSQHVDLLSSQPKIYYEKESTIIAPISSPEDSIEALDRYIQKSVYRWRTN